MFCVEASRLPDAESRVKRKGVVTLWQRVEVEEVEAHAGVKIPSQGVRVAVRDGREMEGRRERRAMRQSRAGETLFCKGGGAPHPTPLIPRLSKAGPCLILRA